MMSLCFDVHIVPIQKPKNLSHYYHKLKVLARSETDLTPILFSDGTRLTMRDDALSHKVQIVSIPIIRDCSFVGKSDRL